MLFEIFDNNYVMINIYCQNNYLIEVIISLLNTKARFSYNKGFDFLILCNSLKNRSSGN